MLSGNRDVDMMILLQLTDYEITQVCQSNKYVRSICNNDQFWFNRTVQQVEKSLTDNLQIYQDNLNIGTPDITQQVIQAKQFYGFDTYAELYKYIVQESLSAAAYYFVVSIAVNFDPFKKYYKITPEKLPKFINYSELVYYLRREIVKRSLRYYTSSNFLPKPINVDGFKTKIDAYRIEQKLLSELYGDLDTSEDE